MGKIGLYDRYSRRSNYYNSPDEDPNESDEDHVYYTEDDGSYTDRHGVFHPPPSPPPTTRTPPRTPPTTQQIIPSPSPPTPLSRTPHSPSPTQLDPQFSLPAGHFEVVPAINPNPNNGGKKRPYSPPKERRIGTPSSF
jgi:hypothetical protein